MKIDAKDIAEKINAKAIWSNATHIEDVIYKMIINQLDSQIEDWTGEVLEELQRLEHPAPRTKAEYDERYGLDRDY